MSLIDQYLHAQGESEVPIELHKWAFISLLAAAARDKVWFMKGSKVFPNLYVLLIASSGVGKGTAMAETNRIARDIEIINAHRIKLTAASLSDLLAPEEAAQRNRNGPRNANRPIRTAKGVDPAKCYLITPELSNSVGSGQQAKDLIKVMTDLYDAQEFNPEEITRTHGAHVIKNPVINWVGGTTKEWLLECLDEADILSGFTARTITVQVDFDPEDKYLAPIYPPDRKEVLDFVKARIKGIANMPGGRFRMTKQARQEEYEWYHSRVIPAEGDAAFPVYRREHDQVLKVAMLMSLANDERWMDLTITQQDFRDAIAEVELVNSKMPELLNYAIQTPHWRVVERARNALRKEASEHHAALLQGLRVRAEDLNSVVKTMKQAAEVREGMARSGDSIYSWAKSGSDWREEGEAA